VTARVAISPLAYGREAGHVSEKREWRVPRLVEVFYPLKFNSTQDRHNWIAAMMLDSRLRDRDKVILIRLALHLNLKTGRLDPTIHLLALETSLAGHWSGPKKSAGLNEPADMAGAALTAAIHIG
jgi:hypothetical protein